ncbi:hypothetical protein PGT21_032683 [Puccinia graminis f. sp. tritici]|uniref:Uncharacterized protein n=2 Tax=Puccinia graminis f. sp. tritici TaxID=56615 RepID=E3L454_PUCGT|nr:uncharacterized protein PGTG_16983 [Puccinia graminis f. sp. tritici CRL 75-36-700-3]EFP91329.1 hypothetical protein PGTG_16983 [Puccinia graminis f. sp. tritici CRL 75-36-700-3]KAA1113498.1 hypothetical protein PGT21_032683 [Puccinia graminis f. sp. tritici]
MAQTHPTTPDAVPTSPKLEPITLKFEPVSPTAKPMDHPLSAEQSEPPLQSIPVPTAEPAKHAVKKSPTKTSPSQDLRHSRRIVDQVHGQGSMSLKNLKEHAHIKGGRPK